MTPHDPTALVALLRRAESLVASARVVALESTLDPRLDQHALTPYISQLEADPDLLPALALAIYRLEHGTREEHGIPPLTPRELAVLGLLALGLSNPEIATDLGITTHTAKFHVQSIMDKLGAQSRTEAVVLATRAGLITL